MLIVNILINSEACYERSLRTGPAADRRRRRRAGGRGARRARARGIQAPAGGTPDRRRALDAVPHQVTHTGAAIQAAARALRAAPRVVVTTGAGMSHDSGIPTFRDAGLGLWARYDPEELATEAAFRRHPARVFGWYAWRRRLVRAALPHAGYHALVALEGLVPELAIVTQNVDGLHTRAGSRRVLELHGSLERFSCLDARHPVPADQAPEPAADTECEPPRCERCGSPVRPDVVW